MKKSLGPQMFAHPTPAWVVANYDQDGKPNATTVAWAGLCSSKPPCVAVSLRDATYSFTNLMQRRAFTLNIPSESMVRQVDYCGIASGRRTDKFAAAGLTAVKSDLVDAPYIEEFPLVLECKVIQVVELGLHTQFIGQIVDVKADEAVLGEKNQPSIEKIRPIVFAPDNFGYYGIGRFLGQAFQIGKELQEASRDK
jgi:flavin reductase (DIM6/NTAB) family NADH-FMN oxidoreductase RutF